MFNGKNVGVIIPAAGSGSRMKSDRPKQYLEIDGKSIVFRTVERFESSPEVDRIILVAAKDSIGSLNRMAESEGMAKIVGVIPGGMHRQDSVWNGLQSLKSQNVDIVVVHDAVRPFVTHEMIRSVTQTALDDGAAVVAVSPKDTIKVSNGKRVIQSTLQRENVWAVQTPQAFRFQLLYSAFERAIIDKFYATDEAALVERLGSKVRIVEGSYDNIKITTAEDLELALLIVKRGNRK